MPGTQTQRASCWTVSSASSALDRRGWPLLDDSQDHIGIGAGATASRIQVTPDVSSAASVSGTLA